MLHNINRMIHCAEFLKIHNASHVLQIPSAILMGKHEVDSLYVMKEIPYLAEMPQSQAAYQHKSP